MRCQCPFGLLFISTAPFWKPRKQSIFQTFFAGIYLKILKTGIFKIIFVMFTICSYFTVLQKHTRLFLQHYILSKRSLTVVYYTTVFYSEKEHFVKSQ